MPATLQKVAHPLEVLIRAVDHGRRQQVVPLCIL